MGKVVNMADWRKQLPTAKTDDAVVIAEIKRLLSEAYKADSSVRTLGTVQARERAVLKGLDLRMQAHRYANARGYEIVSATDPDGLEIFVVSRIKQ